jgi:hypothetical protein
MSRGRLVGRTWVYELVPDEVRARASYRRRGKRIVSYAVQLEAFYNGAWQPVVRYDNAHGFCHCDTIHPDGTHDKTAMRAGDANDNFTRAIRGLSGK